MGHDTSKGQEKEAGGVGREHKPWKRGETLGAPGVDPETHGVGGEKGGRE